MARCPANLWQNELDRWDSLDNRKLLTRLNRITKPEKLACFLKMAHATRSYNLFGRAVTRCNDLGFGFVEPITGEYDVVPLRTSDGRTLRRMPDGTTFYGDPQESRASSPIENPEGPDHDDIKEIELTEEDEVKGIYDRLHKRKVRWRKK
jgi:hypothetical protein